MQDIIRTTEDLGRAIRALRLAHQVTTVELARRTGRSRDLLHRLETGRDVSVSALLDVVLALGHTLSLSPTGLPTLEEMRRRFATDDEDDA